MPSRVKGWRVGAPLTRAALTWIDVLLALVLSAGAVFIVSGSADRTGLRGGVFPCAAVLLMTLPLAARRSRPLTAMGILAGGAVFNAVIVGSYVRCGAALPALALVTFSVGTRCALWPALAGAALAVVSTVAQGMSDPQLKHGFLPGGSVLILALWGVARLVRSRDGMVTILRARTQELQAQRERTARLAVVADRARVAEDLSGPLGKRIGGLAAAAASARDELADRPEVAHRSLTAIEEQGRQTLTEMREIVGALQDAAAPPHGRQPSLDDLGTLVSGGRLVMEGSSERLPTAVELAAFRIIERLLEPFDDVARARVQVTVRHEPERLNVVVCGRLPADADQQAALAAAGEWVSLHAGTLESRQLPSGLRETSARLSLISGHA